jgi:putative selenium metabolism protein SsnA
MLITNATVVTWERPNRILPAHAVRVDDGVITAVAPTHSLRPRSASEDVIEAGGQIVMPGSICAHTHFYGAFARGMALTGPAPEDFPQILDRLWWRIDRALGPDDVRASAQVCLVDAVRHGTTTLFDHHASPNHIAGSLDLIAEAVEQAGVRASLCYEVTDRNGAEGAQAGIDENIRFMRRPRGGALASMFGLHASLTLSDATLERCRAAAPAGMGFHVHVAEHEVDERDSLDKTGQRVVARFERLGLLGERSMAIHCVHIDPTEMEILARTRTWVTHQPRSNMNNGVGAAPVESLIAAGVRVALGNDGFSNAMWDEWKAAYLAHKLAARDPRTMPGDVVADMAAYNNADLATLQFGVPIGHLAEGQSADLMLVDYQPTTPLTTGNLPWHILFGFQTSMITATMAAGQWLMRDRRLLTLDEARITCESRELAGALWKRMA